MLPPVHLPYIFLQPSDLGQPGLAFRKHVVAGLLLFFPRTGTRGVGRPGLCFGMTSPELPSGYCCIGSKAKVYDAELHAIQEGLLQTLSTDWRPSRVVVCVDN